MWKKKTALQNVSFEVYLARVNLCGEEGEWKVLLKWLFLLHSDEKLLTDIRQEQQYLW